MTRFNLMLAAAIALTTLAGAQAQANPIYLGASFNGSPMTTELASGEGSAGVNGYQTGTYNISFSATGSPALTDPNFGSNTLTVKSNGAGTITLYATETNDTARVPSFNLGLSNNPLSDISVTESDYAADNNGKFALSTLLGSATLNPGDTVNLNAPFGTLTGTYSITEVYTITFGRSGGTVNATILEKANTAVPEPMSISLLGAGVASLGFIRLHRKA